MNTATAPNINGTHPAAGAPAGAASAGPMSSESVRESLTGKFVCPFCGSVNDAENGVCVRCTMENTAATRKATKQRIGPWYVLQSRNPAAPGMRFETLLAFVRKGRVKPKSVVRGPTTHQLWKFAAHVKGLSREFGLCYFCGGGIETSANLCPQCNRLQDPPPNPDVLLETGKEAAAPSAAAPAAPAMPAGAAPARGGQVGPREPRLEAGDADFVVPALGGGSDESLAGFSLGSATVNPDWARIDPASNRTRPGRGGEGQGSTPRGAGAQAYSDPPRPPARPPRPTPSAASALSSADTAVYPAIGASPVAGNGDRRRREREPEGGFLSAKDLAAAFKLDFTGDAAPAPEPAPAHPAPGAARQSGRSPVPPYPQPHAPVQPRGQAPSSIPPGLREPVRTRRRFAVLKGLLLVVLTCAAMYGAAIWIDEGFRRDSFEWFARLKASLIDSGNGSNRRKTAPAGGSGAAPKAGDRGAGAAATTPAVRDDGAAPSQYSPSDRTVETDPFEDRQPQLASTKVGAGAATQPAATTAPSAVTPAATKPVASGNPKAPQETAAQSPGATQPGLPLVAGVPEARTSFVSPPSASAPADGHSPAQVLAAEKRMWELYLAARDLERTDAAKAAAMYREIKKLPKDVWPTDLEISIRRAEDLHRIRHPGG